MPKFNMLATLRRLLLVSAGAIALSSPVMAQVSPDLLARVQARADLETQENALPHGLAAYERADYAEAVRWYRLAADQGNARAQGNLGTMYQDGRGVPQNYAEAVRWYRLAADQGHANAQLNLGAMYANGLGVPQNDAEAVRWYRLAADQGYAFAQGMLGFSYALGKGVPENLVESYKWLSLDAAQRADAAEGRDLVRGRMTPAQIAEGQKLAAEWKPEALSGVERLAGAHQ